MPHDEKELPPEVEAAIADYKRRQAPSPPVPLAVILPAAVAFILICSGTAAAAFHWLVGLGLFILLTLLFAIYAAVRSIKGQ